MPNIWTEDDFTIVEASATGRRALVLPTGTVELGATGVRDITGDLISGTVASGRVLLERIGSNAALIFDNLVLATGDGTTNVNIRQASTSGPILSFRPRYTEVKSMKVNSGGHVVRLQVGTGMSLQVHFGLAGVAMNGSVNWLTEAGWPSTLPGVADGESL